MRSAGMGLGWTRLESLIRYLEDANLLYRIPEYTTSVSENSRKAQKVYANDQSLMLAVSPSTSVDRGLALETAVYLELRRRQTVPRKNQIMTYAVQDGSSMLEVDFVKGDRLFDSVVDLVQVSESLADARTRRREVRALRHAIAASGEREGTIVTLREADEISVDEGLIRVVPAWRWLLSSS